MGALINVRIRIWFLITATRFSLRRRREIEFVLPPVYLISVNTYVLKKTFSSLKGFQTEFCKSNESELPINKFYASRNLVNFNFVKGKSFLRFLWILNFNFLCSAFVNYMKLDGLQILTENLFYHQFKFIIAPAKRLKP